jgi:hypothetical protein
MLGYSTEGKHINKPRSDDNYAYLECGSAVQPEFDDSVNFQFLVLELLGAIR